MRLSHLGQHGSPRGLYISPTNNEREERSKTVGTVCVEGFYNAVPVVAAELPGEVVSPRWFFFFSTAPHLLSLTPPFSVGTTSTEKVKKEQCAFFGEEET